MFAMFAKLKLFFFLHYVRDGGRRDCEVLKARLKKNALRLLLQWLQGGGLYPDCGHCWGRLGSK